MFRDSPLKTQEKKFKDFSPLKDIPLERESIIGKTFIALGLDSIPFFGGLFKDHGSYVRITLVGFSHKISSENSSLIHFLEYQISHWDKVGSHPDQEASVFHYKVFVKEGKEPLSERLEIFYGPVGSKLEPTDINKITI